MTHRPPLRSSHAASDHRDSGGLLPQVYDELRKLAGVLLAREAPGNTLDATSLVHEAYVRLSGTRDLDGWAGRGHFFAAAARTMRVILVDSARRRSRHKRGAGWKRRQLNPELPAVPSASDQLIAVDAALTRLAVDHPQAAKLVELRYFGGLSIEQSAETLGISSRTANRVWRFARAWLHRELTAGGADEVSENF